MSADTPLARFWADKFSPVIDWLEATLPDTADGGSAISLTGSSGSGMAPQPQALPPPAPPSAEDRAAKRPRRAPGAEGGARASAGGRRGGRGRGRSLGGFIPAGESLEEAGLAGAAGVSDEGMDLS